MPPPGRAPHRAWTSPRHVRCTHPGRALPRPHPALTPCRDRVSPWPLSPRSSSLVPIAPPSPPPPAAASSLYIPPPAFSPPRRSRLDRVVPHLLRPPPPAPRPPPAAARPRPLWPRSAVDVARDPAPSHLRSSSPAGASTLSPSCRPVRLRPTPTPPSSASQLAVEPVRPGAGRNLLRCLRQGRPPLTLSPCGPSTSAYLRPPASPSRQPRPVLRSLPPCLSSERSCISFCSARPRFLRCRTALPSELFRRPRLFPCLLAYGPGA